MINSLSDSLPLFNRPPAQTPLSGEQKALVSETLSLYDSSNLSVESAQEIVTLFSESGITPGKALGAAISEAGFDPREIAQKGGVNPPPSSPPETSSQKINLTELIAQLDELLSVRSNDVLSKEEKTDIYEQIRERFELSKNQPLLDVTA